MLCMVLVKMVERPVRRTNTTALGRCRLKSIILGAPSRARLGIVGFFQYSWNAGSHYLIAKLAYDPLECSCENIVLTRSKHNRINPDKSVDIVIISIDYRNGDHPIGPN